MNTQKRSLECQRSGCNCYLKNIPHKKNSKRTSPIKSSKTHASMRIKSTITLNRSYFYINRNNFYLN